MALIVANAGSFEGFVVFDGVDAVEVQAAAVGSQSAGRALELDRSAFLEESADIGEGFAVIGGLDRDFFAFDGRGDRSREVALEVKGLEFLRIEIDLSDGLTIGEEASVDAFGGGVDFIGEGAFFGEAEERLHRDLGVVVTSKSLNHNPTGFEEVVRLGSTDTHCRGGLAELHGVLADMGDPLRVGEREAEGMPVAGEDAEVIRDIAKARSGLDFNIGTIIAADRKLDAFEAVAVFGDGPFNHIRLEFLKFEDGGRLAFKDIKLADSGGSMTGSCRFPRGRKFIKNKVVFDFGVGIEDDEVFGRGFDDQFLLHGIRAMVEDVVFIIIASNGFDADVAILGEADATAIELAPVSRFEFIACLAEGRIDFRAGGFEGDGRAGDGQIT